MGIPGLGGETAARPAISLAGCLIALTLVTCLFTPARALAAPAPGTGSGPNYCAQYGSSNSAYSLDNVYACATTASNGATPFDSNGTQSFQCVELSARFLWAVYGIYATGIDTGADLVNVTHSEFPSIGVGSPGPGSVPAVGDVVSLGPGGFTDASAGHTAVVVSSNQATGAFTIMSQNFPDGSAGEQNLQVDLGGGHNGEVSYGGAWSKASWLELKSATPLHSSIALIPGGGGAGYSLDGYGGIHPFGGAPAVSAATGSWPGWDIARSIAVAPNSSRAAVTGYVLDGYGGVHPFAAGTAGLPPAERNGPYWSGWDIARGLVLSTPTSGYVLDGYGAVHPFAAGSTADPPGVSTSAYWSGWDIARGLALATPTSGYVLDGYGGIHPFAGGGESMPPAPDGRAAYWSGWDIARSITLSTPSTGYVLDGFGGVHPFAPGGVALPASAPSPGYSSGHDNFKAIAFDRSTGAGADVNAFLSDGSPGTVYPFNLGRTEAHTAVALIPGGGGAGYSLDGYGHLHPFGGAPAVSATTGSWPGWDIARGIALAPDSTRSAVTGYVLDGYGGVHPFAAGAGRLPPGERAGAGPYWAGWDIARAIVLSTDTSGYVLDGYGGIHPFAAGSTAEPPPVSGAGYWPGWDIARAIVLSTPTSGYQLDGYGGIHPFAGGGAAMPPAPDGRAAYWPGWDIARSIALATPTSGYVLDGWGGIHPFAPKGASLPSLAGTTLYWAGWDVFDALAFDPASGIGVDVNLGYLDGSGDTLSTFTGPVSRSVTVASGGRGQPPVTVIATGGRGGALTFEAGSGAALTIKVRRPGRVRIEIVQRRRGRMSSHGCHAHLRRGRRCSLVVKRAVTSAKLARGVNRVSLPIRRLRPGRYSALVTEHVGSKLRSFSFKFTITPKPTGGA